MAQRDDPALFQCCTLCTTYYCNIYYPPCKAGAKLTKLVDCKEKCKIDAVLLRGNTFEFEALRNYLLLKKMNSRDIFDHMMELVHKGKFSYSMDRKVMKVPPLASRDIKLDDNTAVCDLCWNDLWFQMVLAFRIEVAGQMPPNVRDRPVCYWGINCRTMEHNLDHAKKYSHCIYQSRF
jgi:E3 ubiquitin-protein ligase CHFR